MYLKIKQWIINLELRSTIIYYHSFSNSGLILGEFHPILNNVILILQGKSLFIFSSWTNFRRFSLSFEISDDRVACLRSENFSFTLVDGTLVIRIVVLILVLPLLHNWNDRWPFGAQLGGLWRLKIKIIEQFYQQQICEVGKS